VKRVDIVIPVLNEAHVLERSVEALRAHLLAGFPYDWRIVIVSNGSTDGTDELGRTLSARHADVALLSLAERGRGRALRYAWTHSSADAVCYMDADLSTGLDSLQPLIEAILEHGYDVATGSRLLPGSRTNRSFRRELISRIYNWIVRLALRTCVRDSQCGFKAVSRGAADLIVPRVVDQSWFFDTELLVLAQAAELPVKEIPVTWYEDPDSRVRIVSTATDDLRGILRVWRSPGAQRRTGAGPAAVERI
jgi:glycosyltransferase involved in cell wall biosynthesis